MKMLVLSFVVVALALLSCNTSNDEKQLFLPGIYTRISNHEYGNESDTVIISLQNSAANEYRIVRRWRYERVLDGQAIEPEYKVVTTAGIYDSQTGILEEEDSRFPYSFDLGKKSLFAGTAEYKKLK